MNNVIIYDASLKAVADLPQAYNISYELRANEVGKASFSIPIDDVHLSEITQRRYAEIYDGDRRIELFRITKLNKQGNELHVSCEHVLATLRDTEINDTLYGSAGTSTAIGEVLAEQTVAHWQAGTCGFTEQFLYEWPRGTSLLKALLDIPARFQSGYFWTFDTSSHPWTINLEEPPTVVRAYIDYGRNMQSIEREEDVTDLVTKLYPHGAKAGADQIGITSVEPSGNEYITNYTYTSEVITRHWTNQNYATEQELYDAAVELLARQSQPKYTYRVSAADMYKITGESIDLFEIGTLVKVSNPEADIDAEVRVMSITKSDLTGKPGDIQLELANKGEEFDFADKVNVNDLSGIDINDIPGGTPGALPGPLVGTGLTVTTDYLGYHVGSDWKTYMDIAGRLWADAGANAYFHFDPTIPSLEIKMTGGATYDDIVQALADAAAAQAAADAAQATADGQLVGFYQDSAPTSGMYYGDIWIDTTDPVPTTDDIYRYQDTDGGYTDGAMSWEHTPNNAVGLVYLDAAGAQSTADGKITTFYQNEAPTSGMSQGDLWVDTDGGNAISVYSGTAWEAASSADALQALADAATAQATADGEIVGFYQDAAPTSGMKFGDIWIDTDGHDPLTTDDIYRYEDVTGGSSGTLDWHAAPNNAVGKVYLNAAGAQSTADGKITTFYQDSEPTSGMSEGDIWVDTDDNNKLYVYSGTAWVMTTNADALQALADAATALEIADGEIVGFYQDAAPTSGMSFGDIWIDTDGHDPLTTDDIYRYQDTAGGSFGSLDWRAAPNNAVGKVYLNAAGAQSTADGKITTFYQDDEPTSGMSEGDIWVDTNDNNKIYVYSGSAWVMTSNADALQALADAATAQATADGQLVGFYQDTAPSSSAPAWMASTAYILDDHVEPTTGNGKFYTCTTAGTSGATEPTWPTTEGDTVTDGTTEWTCYDKDTPYYGDIWIDTDGADPLDTTCIYRYQDASGGYTSGAMSWVNAPNNAVGKTYLDAANAQAAADGKITTYYQTSAPSGASEGDLWVDTDDDNKVYRWNGSSWDSVTGAVAHLNILTDAYIQSLSFDKITAATNTASLTIGSGGYLQSANYSSGSAGFRINGNGNAEFNSVTVRGALIAGSGSSINGAYIGNATIVDAKLSGTLSASRIAANSITTSKLYIDGDVDFAANGSRHGIYYINRLSFGTSISALPGIEYLSGNLYIETGSYDIVLETNSGSTTHASIKLDDSVSKIIMGFGGDTLSFVNATTTGGGQGKGELTLSVNGYTRHIQFFA